MPRPFSMKKVIITGPHSVFEKVVKELHDMKVLHVVDHSKNELADIGKPFADSQRYSELLVKARALISALGVTGERKRSNGINGIEEAEIRIRNLGNELNGVLHQIKEDDETISKNESMKKELLAFGSINVPLEHLAEYKSLNVFAGNLKDAESIDNIKKKLKNITDKSLFEHESSFFVFFVESKKKEETLKLLNSHGFKPIQLSNFGSLKGTANSNISRMEHESNDCLSRKIELTKRLERMKIDNAEFLLKTESHLSKELEKLEAPLKCASTESCFLVKGWVPENDLFQSIENLEKVSGGKIHVWYDAPKSSDNVPVKLNNINPAKPFEFFLDLYSFPTFKEIDPTFFVFLTFPLFFGMMLGDVGYGLVGMVLFWFLKRKIKSAKNLFNILIVSSFVSILFGFLFGEIFGYEFIEHPVINRAHDILTLMIISVIIGAVHLNFGFILGFINERKSHGLMHAINTKLSWIVLQIGIVLIGLSLSNLINLPWYTGAGFLALSVIMLIKGEGIRGVIELPSILSNILSYVRIMAIGLSSVILALIINESASEFFKGGPLLIIIGVLLLIVGHAVNIMLGFLGSFLHSLRLHYVEYFSKFFHGGAKKYVPFGYLNNGNNGA